jgi:hypothetical protein
MGDDPAADEAPALAQLAAAGLDLAHAFDAHAAAAAPGWGCLAPPAPPRGLLVGNTRALWAPFSAARARGELAGLADPLDRYTERAIAAAFPGARVYFAHRDYGGHYLPFQRLAVATGLGALSPGRLVIHPVFGPWFALRAVVVVPGLAPVRAPVPRACACTGACERAFAAAAGATFGLGATFGRALAHSPKRA